jgi:acyl carrier protein
MEAMLARETGVAVGELSEYLDRRGKFLAAVVRADLETLGQWTGTPLPAGREPAEPGAALPEIEEAAAAAEDVSEASIYDTLLSGIEQLTGFPPETMAPEMRLIDDLNLDSIKAADLIASVSKRLGIAGEMDPGKFANATLREIADVLAHLVGEGEEVGLAAVPKAETRARPAWVRNFVVEHVVEEAAPSAPSPEAGDWAGETVLVLCERGEEEVAEAVRRCITDQGAKVDRRFFDSWPA